MLYLSQVQVFREERALFKAVSLTLPPESCCLVTAPNGRGKSSLLKAVAGLIPFQGEIRYTGDYHFLTHQNALLPLFSVLELIDYWAALLDHPLKIKGVEQLLKTIDLWDKRHHGLGVLSAGQQRKLNLLILALFERSLWLLDEPYNALDRAAMLWLDDLMSHHLKKGGLILLISHQKTGIPHTEYVLQEAS